ncbi:MAG: D-alanyl-D-alanine endopeptidase (penicillin-binding protein 7) [Kiritimatiellia bacterium]|jgi:D-alanyl-D-alanine endopeptidase (penicillin-binding protein 7)
MKILSVCLTAAAVTFGLGATASVVAPHMPPTSTATPRPVSASLVPPAWMQHVTNLFAVAPPTPKPSLPDEAWSPPTWLPTDGPVDPWVLASLDNPDVHTKGPRVRARGAIVADLDNGQVLWSRHGDTRYPVASLTKLISALTLVRTEPDLDRTVCVSMQHWPSRRGARSRFETGVCHDGWDYVGAALVASDNRGAYGMAPLAGLPTHAFIDQMHQVSAELGALEPTWTDPSGLQDDNMASPRDMLKIVAASAAHPTLAMVGSAPSWEIERRQGAQVLGSTNRLVRSYDTVVAKTGYTHTAGWCFATVVRTKGGRTLAAVVLGSPTKVSRFSDARHMLQWASKN